MREQTAYERVYLDGKQAERERILDAIKQLKTISEDLTQEIVYVTDLEREIKNGN